MFSNIKVISFDADDTLWVNEPFYRETEDKFCDLLKDFHPKEFVNHELLITEIRNLPLYGYGAKGFILSLLETALNITDNKLPQHTILEILDLGKQLLNKPLEILNGVEDVLKYLKSKNYKLIVATKGDLLDQERKLNNSGLSKYFHHIEVMSDKQTANYKSLINHLDIKPEEFLMIGNSMRSDILPIIEIGASAIYIPFHTSWIHEDVEQKYIDNNKFTTLESISQVMKLF